MTASVRYELLPLGHHTSRTAVTVPEGTSARDPAFVVADKDAADQWSLAVSLVRFRQWDRAVGSTATILRQSLRQTQDRVLWVDADVVGLSIERNDDAEV